ncbi:hypothetical protein COCOBI_03-5350 [Coccomyxa sp. Obi]|nr:hypothetical protein COCOBI_03-5350 [Coccomyxa sp. Obi]
MLNQTSAFGAWLDVAIDNTSRGVLYAWTLPGPAAAFPIALEFLTFVATHKGGGAAWKTGCFSQAPAWVKAVMDNGFRTPAGILAISGLMGLPLWLWARSHFPTSFLASFFVGGGLMLGRLVSLGVEIWVLYKHLENLLNES